MWRARAAIFSGRPDPTWEVDAGAVRELEQIWASLESAAELPAPPPLLGYRGCSLTEEGQRAWQAYGGVVTLESVKGAETRKDPDRRFEQRLLRTAPAGMIPRELLH